MIVKLTRSQKERLRAVSKKLDLSVQTLVRKAVEDFLLTTNIDYRLGKFALSSLYGSTARSRGDDDGE